MFRIDAEEVRSELGLERRKSKLYSLDEISKQWGRVSKIVDAVLPRKRKRAINRSKNGNCWNLIAGLGNYTLTAAAFQLPIPEEIPAEIFEKVFPGPTSRRGSSSHCANWNVAWML